MNALAAIPWAASREVCFFPNSGCVLPNMGNTSKRAVTPAWAGRRPGRRESSSGLAAALFTATQQRVLGLLFGQPERSFYVSEILARTGTGAGALHRELKRLAEVGLVMVSAVGNQRHYQANPAAPIYGELCSLMRKTVAAVDPLRRALAKLRGQIRLALLYGSVAKGSDKASSDLDVLIVADDLSLETVYAALAPVERELGRRVSPTLYSVGEFRRRRREAPSFLNRVLAGNTVTLIGDPDAADSPR